MKNRAALLCVCPGVCAGVGNSLQGGKQMVGGGVGRVAWVVFFFGLPPLERCTGHVAARRFRAASRAAAAAAAAVLPDIDSACQRGGHREPPV